MKKSKSILSVSVLLTIFTLMTSCDHSKSTNEAKAKATDSASARVNEPVIEAEVMGNAVRIGKQTWMLRNLDVKTYRNGDPVFEVRANPDWEKQCEKGNGVFGYIMNKPEMENTYGLIYNWYAVNDPRGLAPEGWRIPSQADWEELIRYLGGERVAGKYLKSDLGWAANGNGTNLSHFAALPGGFKGYYGESYQEGFTGGWWTNTEISDYFAVGFSMVFDDVSVKMSNGYKFDGFSVRCIKE